MQIVAIGDTHFKVDNMNIVDKLIEEIVSKLTLLKPDLIVLLGDILHDHERLHTLALNRALDFINKLRNISKVFVLVGNHDMINHDQFLSDQHWMNALKHWDNVCIVDKVEHLECSDINANFLFCPYVAPGRFQEALETHEFDWRESDIIFAHQEFKGCKMGAIISEDGDEWDIDDPFVISGHIHSKQSPQDNIMYPGSSMQVAYGESNENIILIVDYNDGEIELTEQILNIPRKRIVYIDTDSFDQYEPPTTEDEIKITIKGKYTDFKAIKKTSKYKKLVKLGFKISYKHEKLDITTDKKKAEVKDFTNVLESLVKSSSDEFLNKAYDKLLNK
jgi:DNA repair exonuclease SbcCD nuclease subunit